MAVSYLLALLDARPSGPPWSPEWLSGVLAEQLHARISRAAEGTTTHRLRGWSVGSVIGNETFVQARPIVRDADNEPVEDVLRTPAPCTIASFQAGTDHERFAESNPSIRMGRFRRWVGVRAEPELDADTRRRLREEIPDFLGRSQTLGNDGELVFLRFLAALHAEGALGGHYAAPESVRRALKITESLLGPGSINFMVSDGRTLGVIHRGGTMLAIAPPNPGGRARKLDEDARVPWRGNLLWFDPGPPPETPPAGAERIAEGVFSIECMRPHTLARD